MSNAPPVPSANQSPFPLQEKPHTETKASDAPAAAASKDSKSATTSSANVATLAANGGKFVQARPWAAAALLGTVAVAIFGSPRARRG